MTATASPTTSTLPAERQEDIVTTVLARRVLAFGRIVIGFLFFWPFLDKLFGLGYATASEKAWINGGTPAQGFLKAATGQFGDPATTPFVGFFKLFINPFGDVLFMLGLFGIGIAMLLGAGVRIAAVTGTLLMILMYMAEWPFFVAGNTNPFVDSHWIEAVVLLIMGATLAGDTWGLGKWWGGLDVVKKNKWLR